MTIKILNLYAGIGGNRKLWDECGLDIEVTAVEWDEKIAKIYKHFFPKDKMIVGDAHQYLLEHFDEFDFIWASPPCPSHSDIRRCATHRGQNKPIYPEMSLYQEIIFLKYFAKKHTKWVVENVVPYYEPLIEGTKIQRHLFWSNINLTSPRIKKTISHESIKSTSDVYGFNISKFDILSKNKIKILRNMVDPELGKHILLEAYKRKDLGAFIEGEKE